MNWQYQFQTGKRLEENKMRTTERAKDAKKIQDLQRQVIVSFYFDILYTRISS